MARIRVAMNLGCLRKPLREALQLARELGASAVELDGRSEPFQMPGGFGETAQRQMLKILDELGLQVASVSFQTRRGYDEAEDLDRRIAATKQAMTLAYSLGARVVTNSVGRVPEEGAGHGWDTMREALLDIARHADRCGTRLAARTGSESPETLLKLLGSLPEGTVGIDLDPAGLIINGYSGGEAMQPLLSHVIHVRGRDAVRDLAIGRGIEVPLGRGTADMPWLVAALDQSNYRGYITVERRDSPNAAAEMGDAIQFLREFVG